MKTIQLIDTLKDSDQDFEWYPTTDEIIQAVARRIESHRNSFYFKSILDIGAGNGKALEALSGASTGSTLKKYAIEKSKPLMATLPNDVFVVGTDFKEQTLFDKDVSITFCNPPYSEFSDWSQKIIRESAGDLVFLVVPQRWRDDQAIEDAIQWRNAEVETVASFDFLHSEDRKARAKVDLLQIEYPRIDSDPFKHFFDAEFSGMADAKELEDDQEGLKRKASELAGGDNFISTLVGLYQAEMEEIERNYHSVGQLDPSILHELQIDLKQIRELLRDRFKNLKKKYWKLVFDNLDAVTSRLTTKGRQRMLETLFANTQVDFTVANAYAIVLWVIKNANGYFESQLIDTYERLISKANVKNYKSNQRVFTWDRWRYQEGEECSTHFALEYRIVAVHCGGICTSAWGKWEKEQNRGLSTAAVEFLSDFATIAANLGFSDPSGPREFDWESNKLNTFTFTNASGDRKTLMEVRAFMNGNMHIRMCPRFALALNVEYGRLKGWLHSSSQADEELNETGSSKYFGQLHQLAVSDTLRIEAVSAPEPPEELTKSAQRAKTTQRRKKSPSPATEATDTLDFQTIDLSQCFQS